MKRMLFLLVVLLFWGSNKVSSQQSILCSVTLEENIPTRFPLSFIDFNFDKNIDLVWHDENKETINVRHLENGSSSVYSSMNSGWVTSFNMGYVDADKYPDLIVNNEDIITYVKNNKGKLGVEKTITTKKINGEDIMTGFIMDIDHDNDGDALVQYDGIGIYLMLNNDGVFDWQNAKKVISTGSGRAFGKVCDLNNDGWQDMVLYNPYEGAYVALNTKSNTLSVKKLSNTWNPCGFNIGDVNNDGSIDIIQGFRASSSSPAGSIEIYLNDSNGQFSRKWNYGGFYDPGAMCVADANMDGINEVFVGERNALFQLSFDAATQEFKANKISGGTPVSGLDNSPFGMVCMDQSKNGKLDFFVSTLTSNFNQQYITKYVSDCGGTTEILCNEAALDLDGDGFSFSDCNDSDALIHPGAAEIIGNFIDENCDGEIQLIPDGYPIISIEEAKSSDTVTGNLINESKLCAIKGTVVSENLLPGYIQVAMMNENGQGIWLFSNEDTIHYQPEIFDSIIVYGKLLNFKGTPEIIPYGILKLGKANQNNFIPSEVLELEEGIEANLIQINNLRFVNKSQWLGNGSNFEVDCTNGNITCKVRIDKDLPLSRESIPAEPFNLIGIGNQFDNSLPFTSGYQILPRYLIDFMTISSTSSVSVEMCKFYPTIVADKLNVSCQDKITEIKIYNMEGVEVKSWKMENKGKMEIDMDFLKPSLYFVKSFTGVKYNISKILKL